MDELDRLLAETMHDAAHRGPADTGLLGAVHERSRRRHRRRVAAVAGVSVAAVLVIGAPVVTALTAGPHPALPPAAPAPAPSAPRTVVQTPTAVTGAPTAAPDKPRVTSAKPDVSTGKPEAAGQVRLTDGWSAPRFPYTLPLVDGRRAPRVSAEGGRLSAFFEATELRENADVTVTVTAAEPASPRGATRTATSVRGHTGTLWTVEVRPARKLTLVWKESPGRWIQLATDDTYTAAEVVAIAGSLSGAAVPVQPPFDLARSPSGLVTDTVSQSRMTFRAPGASTAGFRTTLRERQPLSGTNRRVGGSDAVLTRGAGRVTLAVDLPDWDATLQVTVDSGLTVSDADLLSYAEGVRILDRSDPE